MKRKMRIVLVLILSFAMTISMGISVYAEDIVDPARTETSINEGQETEGNESEELEKAIEEPPAESDKSVDQAEAKIPVEPEVTEETVETEEEPEAPEEEPEPPEEEPGVTEEEPGEPELPVNPETPAESETPVKSETPEVPADQVDNKAPVDEIAPPVAPVELVTEIQVQRVALRAEVMLDDKVSNGDILNYKIILNNNGDLDIAELLISDDLGLNRQIGNLKSAEEETISGSFEVDRFNELEQIENEIDIMGEVDGRQIDLSLAFIAEVEIIKGTLKISIVEKENTGQVFDIFIEGEDKQSGVFTVSLEDGKSIELNNLWPDKYTIKTITPMNYEPIEDISVDLTQDNLKKFVKIEQNRNNIRWFSSQDTELIEGEAIAARRSMIRSNSYKIVIEEKRFDEVSFEIEVPVVVESEIVELVVSQPVLADPILPEQPEAPEDPEQPEATIPDDPSEESNDEGAKEQIDEKIKELDKATEPDEISPPKDPEEEPISSD